MVIINMNSHYGRSTLKKKKKKIPDLKPDGKKLVLNAGTELGPGRGCSRMLGMHLGFLREKFGFQEMAFGNADLLLNI